MAPVRRVNSVALSTAQLSAVGKRLQQDDIAEMLVTNKFGPEKVAGIQYLPHRQIVVIKFERKAEYERFLGLESVRVSGIKCRIFDLSSEFTNVTIMGAPFETEKQELIDLLNCYGDVKSIRKRLISCEKHRLFNAIPDGTWIATMDIKKNIPSYLLINDSQLFIRYEGQEKTCRLCGSSGHIAKDCRQTKTSSTISPADFPALIEKNLDTVHPAEIQQSEPTAPTSEETMEINKETTSENQHDDTTECNKETTMEIKETSTQQIASPAPTPASATKARRALLQEESTVKEPTTKLRPLKKRRKAPIPTTTSEEETADNCAPDSPLQFIDLDKNYIVTLRTSIQSDVES